ncbi:MAG: hotdog fold thioesterase [Deltaproteobacteria bacterium]|nr:hotdog fold thioesterase [Deltaproteobacteria bacterium]
MTIWKSPMTPEQINSMENTIVNHLDIKITEVGDDYIKATMPVDHRTHQPMGILHGGASVVLAETLGSIAAHMAGEPGTYSVGLEVNANHVRSVSKGLVTGVGRPVHVGRTTQIWDIKIVDEEGKTVCVSRLTMAVLNNK